MEEYDFEVQDRTREQITFADALSRLSLQEAHLKLFSLVSTLIKIF